MARWLFKEEPEEYSFNDLQRDGEATWDGVANALALKHLRSVRVGDEVYFYHTGKEKAIVGVMRVTAVAETDGVPIVTVKPVRELKNPVPLADIKAEPLFANWELVRMSRLSVLPVPDALWKRIEELAKRKAAG